MLKESAQPYHIIPLVKNCIKYIVKTVLISDCPEIAVVCNKIKFYI